MADQVNEYKCSNCGGPLRFDPASQMLVCDNCGSVYQPEEIEALYLEHSLAAAQLDPADCFLYSDRSGYVQTTHEQRRWRTWLPDVQYGQIQCQNLREVI